MQIWWWLTMMCGKTCLMKHPVSFSDPFTVGVRQTVQHCSQRVSGTCRQRLHDWWQGENHHKTIRGSHVLSSSAASSHQNLFEQNLTFGVSIHFPLCSQQCNIVKQSSFFCSNMLQNFLPKTSFLLAMSEASKWFPPVCKKGWVDFLDESNQKQIFVWAFMFFHANFCCWVPTVFLTIFFSIWSDIATGHACHLCFATTSSVHLKAKSIMWALCCDFSSWIIACSSLRFQVGLTEWPLPKSCHLLSNQCLQWCWQVHFELITVKFRHVLTLHSSDCYLLTKFKNTIWRCC